LTGFDRCAILYTCNEGRPVVKKDEIIMTKNEAIVLNNAVSTIIYNVQHCSSEIEYDNDKNKDNEDGDEDEYFVVVYAQYGFGGKTKKASKADDVADLIEYCLDIVLDELKEKMQDDLRSAFQK